MSSWLSLRFADLEEFPAGMPGAFALVYDGRVVYVGSGLCLKGEFANFRKVVLKKKPGYRVERFVIKIRRSERIGDWLQVALRLVLRLEPVLNTVPHTWRKIKNSIKRSKENGLSGQAEFVQQRKQQNSKYYHSWRQDRKVIQKLRVADKHTTIARPRYASNLTGH